MFKLIPVADDDVCLTAVKVYVEKLQEAGLPVELCDSASDADVSGESIVRVAWGRGDDRPDDEERFDNMSDDDGWDVTASILAPTAVELYTRNLLYLGSNPQEARNWLLNEDRRPDRRTIQNSTQSR